MKKYKAVFSGKLDPSLKQLFISEAPSNIELSFIDSGFSLEEATPILKEADFLIVHKKTIHPAELLLKTEKLKLMQSFAIGTERLPIKAAAERGIHLCYPGNIPSQSVAEHTILLILATLKRLKVCMDMIRSGKNNPEWDIRHIHSINGKIVGIVGFGNIGQVVAKMVRGLGASVIFTDLAEIPEPITTELKAKKVSLNELLSVADIVSLHVPILDVTRNMIGWNQLQMMKPSSILINTSRGAVIDEPMLIKALHERKIAGAGLDVFAVEPPVPDNPLFHMDNVVATPHIASEVWENYLLLIRLAYENITRVLEGRQPLYPVIQSK